MFKQLFPLFLILLPLAFSFKLDLGDKNLAHAEKIYSTHFDNLYKVSPNLYRSEQPSNLGMIELEMMRVKTIINLRNLQNDKREAINTNLTIKHIPINTWRFCYNDIIKSLKEIECSEKPVLVHCLHGSDRTGAVVAAYRMAYQNWSKEDAIAEFTNEKFGYHQKWFPEILAILNTMDVEKLKEEVNRN